MVYINMQKNNLKTANFSVAKIITYPFVGLLFIANLFFKFIKYIFTGILYVLYINVNFLKKTKDGFLYITHIIIKPFKIKNKDNSKKKKAKKTKDIKVVEKKEKNKKIKSKEEKKEIKKNEPKNLINEEKNINIKQINNNVIDDVVLNYIKEAEKKKKAALKRNLRKKLDSEAYVNENVKITKEPFSKKIKKVLLIIPLLFAKIGKKFKNNIFSKDIRNKKDMKRQTLLIDYEGADAVKSEKKVLYEYVAKDLNGKIVKDYFNAYSKVEVHSYLLSEGYEVYSIKTNKMIQILHSNTSTNKTKFKNKDLIFFLTQLSTYIKAGIPLVEALRIVARQYKNKKYQKIFRAVIYELTIGESFSSAMEMQDVAFPKLLINMVKTAEMTGSLPEVLDDMANYYSEVEASRKQMITAMTYPTLVFIFAIAVMIFVMVFVVPQFVEIYESMDTELPTITVVILKMSAFLKKKWFLLLLCIVLVIILLIYCYKKIKIFRTLCQWMVMKMPVFKNVIIYNEVTLFTKTFSSLLAHNVPITDCMEILNKITNNEIYKMLILDTISNLARGGKISDAFKDHWAFPVPAYEMIVTGEATGELSEMMEKVSLYYQDLHKNTVTRLKTFIEPILTIFLTAGVGIIILSIIVPMFQMYSAVQDME